MKDLNILQRTGFIEAINNITFSRMTRIAFGSENDARRVSRPPFNGDAVELPSQDRFANIDKIGFEPNEDRLRFRVAKSDVVFQQFRLRFGHHQTEEQNSAQRKSFVAAAAQGRFDYVVKDVLRLRFGQQVCIGDRSHTAGVWTRITFADAFVVPSRRHQRKILAVRKKYQRNFPAKQAFFQNDRASGFGTCN